MAVLQLRNMKYRRNEMNFPQLHNESVAELRTETPGFHPPQVQVIQCHGLCPFPSEPQLGLISAAEAVFGQIWLLFLAISMCGVRMGVNDHGVTSLCITQPGPAWNWLVEKGRDGEGNEHQGEASCCLKEVSAMCNILKNPLSFYVISVFLLMIQNCSIYCSLLMH